MGRARVQRLDRRLDDVRGGREVRFADLQMDDLPAGVLDGPGAGEDLEGGFGAEPGHAVCEPDTCHGLMINL